MPRNIIAANPRVQKYYHRFVLVRRTAWIARTQPEEPGGWPFIRWERQRREFGMASNNPHDVVNFIWGHCVADWRLFINGREYNMPNPELTEAEEHLRYLLDLDLSFHDDPHAKENRHVQ